MNALSAALCFIELVYTIFLCSVELYLIGAVQDQRRDFVTMVIYFKILQQQKFLLIAE